MFYDDYCSFVAKESRNFYATTISTWTCVNKFNGRLPKDYIDPIIVSLNSYSIIISDMINAVQLQTLPKYIDSFHEAKMTCLANLNRVLLLWALLTRNE